MSDPIRLDTYTCRSNGKPVGTLLQAASIALAVLKGARTATWSDLPSGIVDGDDPMFALDADQVALIERHFDQINLVRPTFTSRKDDANSSRMVSLAECRDCGRWMLASAGWSKPSKCVLTADCEGKMDKAKQASKVKKAASASS